MTTPSIAPNLPGESQGEKTWRVGTLVYNRAQLVNVFVWMLWGDFCLYLMDAGVGNELIPIQLKKYGASNLTISVLKNSIVEFLIIVLCPIVSTWSDRHRSRRGRRIPFMLYATPPLAIFLSLVGFSPNIAQWLNLASPNLLRGISIGGLTISLITVLNVAYKFCDIFPQSVYYYLWADVIPKQLMGTFSCMFRVFATAGVYVFSQYLYGYCNDHPAPLCVGAAVLYLISFMILCWQVKEGGYPPPPPLPPGPFVERSRHSIVRFCRECFTLSFYWKYYIYTLCFIVGFIPFRDFLKFYATQDLKMDLGWYGKVYAKCLIVQMIVFFLVGLVVDRLHPIRAGLIGFFLVFVAGLGCFFFIHSTGSFQLWAMISYGAVAVYQGATGAIGPLVLPRTHYGQFNAASALVFHFGAMILTPVIGWLTDKYGNAALFPWFFSFSALGILFLWIVYRDWKRLGGESFVPPVPGSEPRGFPVEPVE